MDKKQEDIVAKKIESGEYFSEAMDWFHAKFTRPRTEASYFFIIAFIAVAAACVGVAAFSRIFPLSPGYNFVVGQPITPDDTIKITSIEATGETVNYSVVKYLLTDYVQSREEYIEKNLERNYRVVTAFSDPAISQEYSQEISLSNPDNPIVRYGNQAKGEITIESITLRDSKGNTAKNNNMSEATVRFSRLLTFTGDNTRLFTHHEADITFQYEQIIVDQKTAEVTQNPKLIITSYKTRTLENSK